MKTFVAVVVMVAVAAVILTYSDSASAPSQSAAQTAPVRSGAPSF